MGALRAKLVRMYPELFKLLPAGREARALASVRNRPEPETGLTKMLAAKRSLTIERAPLLVYLSKPNGAVEDHQLP